jgi:hypothetical protein
VSHYEDLSPCRYFSHLDPLGERLKAVGWLASGCPYSQGVVPSEDFHQLLKLLEKPWQPCFLMGYHECEFCPRRPLEVTPEERAKGERITCWRTDTGVEVVQISTPETEAFDRQHRLERNGLVVRFGAANLFVPADGCIYVAPSMIAHYIDEHGYDPPSCFWEAVLNCPEMRTPGFRQAMIANGPSSESWLRAVHWEEKPQS